VCYGYRYMTPRAQLLLSITAHTDPSLDFINLKLLIAYYCLCAYNLLPLLLQQCTFQSNFATNIGGGMYVGGIAVSVNDCAFVHNKADGGSAIANYAALTVNNTLFFNGTAATDGAAIFTKTFVGMLKDSVVPSIKAYNSQFIRNTCGVQGAASSNINSTVQFTKVCSR
jgi:hypothetical protein